MFILILLIISILLSNFVQFNFVDKIITHAIVLSRENNAIESTIL